MKSIAKQQFCKNIHCISENSLNLKQKKKKHGHKSDLFFYKLMTSLIICSNRIEIKNYKY